MSWARSRKEDQRTIEAISGLAVQQQRQVALDHS
jgi:hypothetical protein